MSDRATWTIDELKRRLRDHEREQRRRNHAIGAALFAFLAIVVVFPFVVSREHLVAGGAAILASFVVVAALFEFSGRGFRRKHGVPCPGCGKSLVGLGQMVYDIDAGIVAKPASIACPSCGNTVAR